MTATAPVTVARGIDHYENFPVASWLCPAQLRAPIAAIYHFARCADDLADEGAATAAQRRRDLQAYRQDLLAAADPAAALSPRWQHIFFPLRKVIVAHALPLTLLQNLLDAFEQDVNRTETAGGYATQADLLDYCRRSANPIGRLLLHLYGVGDQPSQLLSDDICTALQLINFWQDPSLDLPRGRNYFVREDCARFGVRPDDLAACRDTPQLRSLLAANVAAARARMQRGAALVHRVPGRAGWELRLVVQGGLRILDKIEALQFATLAKRPRLRWWDWALLLWRAARMSQ